MSLFGEPSPEREPSRPGGSLPRATLKVRDLNLLSVQIPLEHIDRLLDVSYLSGITPNEEALQYVWQSLRRHQLIDVDTFNDHLGPLGLSLEMKVSTRHELVWRDGQYTDKTSIVLSTKHHEGSDLGALRNENEGHPGQEGLLLEIVASDEPLAPLTAIITWDDETLRVAPPGVRWDFLRTFHSSIKFSDDLPEELPVAPGHRENFHFVHVEMGSAVVRAERIEPRQEANTSLPPQSSHSSSNATEPSTDKHGGVALVNPPAEVLAKLLTMTEALQLNSPWTTAQTRLHIVEHLLDVLAKPKKFNADTLMMCEGAHPCLTFSLDETSDAESYPAKRSVQVSMMDYTCGTGDFALHLTQNEKGLTASCRWSQRNVHVNQIPWNNILTLVKPYSPT